jgi:hypothetical protein
MKMVVLEGGPPGQHSTERALQDKDTMVLTALVATVLVVVVLVDLVLIHQPIPILGLVVSVLI